MQKPYLIYIPCPSAEEARRIGSALIEDRLAACANILPGMDSLFWWEGRVQSESEYLLLLKTTDKNFDTLKERAVELHPYDCPCVVALPIEAGHQAFLHWIAEETR